MLGKQKPQKPPAFYFHLLDWMSKREDKPTDVLLSLQLMIKVVAGGLNRQADKVKIKDIIELIKGK